MIKKLTNTEENDNIFVKVEPKWLNWDKLHLTENVIVIQRVTIKEADEDYPEWINGTYAIKQPNNRWIWLVGGVTSLTCGALIGDHLQNLDFETLEDCVDHYMIFWTVTKD